MASIHGTNAGNNLFGTALDDDIIGAGLPFGNSVRQMVRIEDLGPIDDHDIIHAGADADNVGGGNGNDQLFGESGDDGIFGGVGRDTIYGGDGFDDLWGGEGNDWVYGALLHNSDRGGFTT